MSLDSSELADKVFISADITKSVEILSASLTSLDSSILGGIVFLSCDITVVSAKVASGCCFCFCCWSQAARRIYRVLGQQVHVAGGDVGVGFGSAGGHGWVQAHPSALLELQGGGWQESLAGYPGWPWPGRPGCGDGGWSSPLPPKPWWRSQTAGVPHHSWCGPWSSPPAARWSAEQDHPVSFMLLVILLG